MSLGQPFTLPFLVTEPGPWWAGSVHGWKRDGVETTSDGRAAVTQVPRETGLICLILLAHMLLVPRTVPGTRQVLRKYRGMSG